MVSLSAEWSPFSKRTSPHWEILTQITSGFSSVSSYVFPCFGCLTGWFQYTENIRMSTHSWLRWMYGMLLSVYYHEEEINSPSLQVFQTFQTQGIGFEVWYWGALCIKQLGDHRAQVGISNHLSDDTSITWWTLLCWPSVACVLWFVPLRDTLKGQQPEMNHYMMWRIKGNFRFFPSGWGYLGSNRNSVMVSSECKVNVLTSQRWEGHGTNTAVNTASLYAPTRLGLRSEAKRIGI